MADSHIPWDDEARAKARTAAAAKLQQEVNAVAQDIIQQVNAEMSGQPVSILMTALQKRMIAAGVKPDIKGLLLYAKKISAGTLGEQ